MRHAHAHVNDTNAQEDVAEHPINVPPDVLVGTYTMDVQGIGIIIATTILATILIIVVIGHVFNFFIANSSC